MEEVRDHEEFKHVCKLCNKRYPSGKSLGGHMRSHVIADARRNKLLLAKKAAEFVEEEDEEVDDDNDNESNHMNDGNGGGRNGYGLRENPKKTWRMVDSATLKNKVQFQQNGTHVTVTAAQENQQERVCKQCGKGFHSLKALCGHMSIHSDKDRHFREEEDYSWSSDSKDQYFVAMESHSDNNSKRQTRSSLSRYRSLTAVDSFTAGGGSSSNFSEIDQLEQEEVAMCLMMLSRDSSGGKACFNFAAESSDNNSVILEGGSSSNYYVLGGRKKDLNKIKEFIFGKHEANADHEMDNSDSGYFENGAKELDSDDSVDGYARNNYGFKKPKVEFGSRLADSYDDDDSRKRRVRDVGCFRFDSPESVENSSKKIKQDHCYNNGDNNVHKGNKYECWICNRTFKSHQALGGHIISHRKNGENNLDSSNSAKVQGCSTKNVGASTTKIMLAKKGTASKKVKGHKCPYCPKVFKSGQALGGHKRSHMLGGSVVVPPVHRSNDIPAPPPEPEHKQPLIDLNLPAPVEEEGNSHFVAW